LGKACGSEVFRGDVEDGSGSDMGSLVLDFRSRRTGGLRANLWKQSIGWRMMGDDRLR
jgi:hypothetical protein